MCRTLHFLGLGSLGPIYTIDHEVRPWKIAIVHGPTSWSNFHVTISSKKTIYKVSMDNASLDLCLLRTSNSMVTITFSSLVQLKWSRDEVNNQSQIYKALGQLHDPWSKQPLTAHTTANDHNNTSQWLRLRGVYVNSSPMSNINLSLQDHRRWLNFQGKFDT